MLKPKKKITKKEIQRDPFLESVDKAQAYLEQRRSLYMKIAIGIIIVLIGYNIITQKSEQRNIEANNLLGQAMVALDRSDVNNSKFQLETIANEYSGTHSAKLAGYYLGKLMYESGDYASAEIHLSKFLKDYSIDLITPAASLMLADIAIQNGQSDNALSLLNRLTNKRVGSHTSRMMELEKAKVFLNQGDLEAVGNIANSILNEKNVSSVQKQIAEELMGKISG
ncbi:MAG: hypothetical protein CMG57_06765 [Candidatus Marinimicrobia bacterium]|nr:hypothetical protein [Candidatus Neomarinimicrobiota bacterium]|tara:strand:+ start:30 stop:704 length:675 start_codon:yes stop_codon:yes gene_type:complete